jgi:hypothetical protein
MEAAKARPSSSFPASARQWAAIAKIMAWAFGRAAAFSAHSAASSN